MIGSFRPPLLPLLAIALLAAFAPVVFAAHAEDPAKTDAADAPASLAGLRAVSWRPFGGPVSRDMAATAAAAAAREELRRDIVRTLITRPEVRFANAPGVSATRQPDLAALADAVAASHILLMTHTASPRSVSVTVAPADPDPDAGLSGRIRDALIHGERLDLYRRAIEREQALRTEYDALAPREPDRPGTASEAENDALRARLQRLARGMEAIVLYRRALPRLDGIWREPQKVLDAMRTALALDQENPALHCAFGEACLQLGRSHEAMEAQTRALRLDPAFARAYHSRGVAYLALRLPALATADFTEAIRLSPRKALYHRDRGMAHLAQKDTAGMCRDFYAACALGDCAQYRWAVDRGDCSLSLSTDDPHSAPRSGR